MYIGVRGRNLCSHGAVYTTVTIAKDLLEEEFYLDSSFADRIDITEKADAKFCKPTNPMENTLYLFVGGWRLVGQDRGKVSISNPIFCGLDIDKEVTLYAPASTVKHKVVTSEGYVIAEVIERHMINILFNICALPTQQQKELLYFIFKDVLTNFYAFDLDNLKAEREAKRQLEITEFLTGLVSRELKEIEYKVESVERNIRSYERDLDALIAKRRRYMAEAEGFRLQASQDAVTLKDEIDKVANLDKVERIFINMSSRRLVITTHDIYIVNAGKRHYIGKFNIEIDPVASSVTFNNLNNRRRSYWGAECHHPHVDQNGRACWGNVGSAISTYIKQNEYQALASLLIGFLESVNTSDPAGRHITSWDVVNNAGLVIQTGYHYQHPPEDTTIYTCYGCQDSFSRDNIAFTRGNVHICRHCVNDYFVCSECGDIHPVEDAEKCPDCGYILICEDCIDEVEQCRHCAEKARMQQELQEGQTICPFCNTVINDDEVYTCESCGEEGCGNCITFDGRFSCPNHR